ncbi:MAG: carbohydrate binding domain-containing protein [Fibrobacteria bacterium]|nr:carbohydrate binding domain-containing protein [Fibrobacteria bacterium]
MTFRSVRSILIAGTLLLAASPTQALLDPCSFNFGMSWDKGPNFPEEVGYVTIWTNSGWDGGYHGGMLNGLKNTDKTPVFYGYLIAKTSGLGDCDVTSGNNLCTDGANYIRRNMDKITNAYKSFAQSAAAIWGKERQIVFMIEPDFYQYFQSDKQGGNPIPRDSANVIMKQIHDAVRSALPQAEFSFDISPWASQKIWFGVFDADEFAWANTSGGRTEGGNTKIRSENNTTWASASTALKRGIIADVGYGVGGGPDANGIAAWNDVDNLNARIADGVVAITNVLADYSWGSTLKAIRPKLTGELASCRETGPKTPKYALSTTVVGSGSIALDRSGSLFDSGTVVRAAAVPIIGYRFVSWTGDATGKDPMVSLTLDKARSLTATFEKTEVGPPVGTGADLVRGGDFSNSGSDWSLAVNCGAATSSIENGVATIQITDAGSAPYCIQWRQTGIELQSGKTYQFSFDAKASGSRTMVGYVGQSGDPYTNYAMGSNADWVVDLTSQMKSFNKSFTMTTTDGDARIDINLGGASTGTVTLDNVVLRSGRALPQYPLTTSVIGTGKHSILRVPDQAKYDSGSSVALFAIPDSTTPFTRWIGDANGTASATVVMLDGEKTVSGVFGTVGVGSRTVRTSHLRREGNRLVVSGFTGSATIRLRQADGSGVLVLHRGPVADGQSFRIPSALARGLYLAEVRSSSWSETLPLPALD